MVNKPLGNFGSEEATSDFYQYFGISQQKNVILFSGLPKKL